MVDRDDAIRVRRRCHRDLRDPSRPRRRDPVDVVYRDARRQPAQRPTDDAGAAVTSNQSYTDAADPADGIGANAEAGPRPGLRWISHLELVDGDGHIARRPV